MRFARLVTLVVVSLALLCGSGLAFAEPVELSVYWCCGQQDRLDMWTAMAKEFESLNAGVKVNLVYPTGTYYDQLTTALIGGVGPDVFWLGTAFWQMADGGLLTPLQKTIAEDPTLRTIPNEILAVNKWQGNTLGVPYGMSMNAVYYNKTMFSQAGLRAPSSWTWEEMVATARKLVRDTNGDKVLDVWGFSIRNSDPWWFYSYGGNPYDAAGKRMSINNSENIAGLDMLAGIYTKGEITPKWAETFDARKAFAGSQLAMNVDGPYTMPTYNVVAGLEYGLAPLPALSYGSKKVQVDVMTPESFCVSSQSKHPDLAISLLKFLTSAKSVTQYAKMGTIVPTIPSTMATFVSSDSKVDRSAFINAIPNIRMHLYQHPIFNGSIKPIVTAERNNVLNGVTPAASALDNIERQSNQLLDEYWAKKK